MALLDHIHYAISLFAPARDQRRELLVQKALVAVVVAILGVAVRE